MKKYLGVTEINGRFKAQIFDKGKNINLGIYDLDLDAAKAFDARSRVINGMYTEKANFPVNRNEVEVESKDLIVTKHNENGTRGIAFAPEENLYHAELYYKGFLFDIGYYETEVLAAFKHDEAVYGLLGSQNVRKLSDEERADILNFPTRKYQDLMQILIFQKKKFMELVMSDIFE